MEKNYDVIGKSVPRSDAYAKVTGQAKYVADLRVPGLTYGKILHSPVAHAMFTKIDTTAAKALPGVLDVITYEDVPEIDYTSCGHPFPYDTPQDMRILNRHARYVGDMIAAVVAETPEIAAEACRLITFEYDELPAYFDPREALKEGAYEIHEGSKNLCGENEYELGNVEEAFKNAKYIIEEDFETPIIAHAQIETHVSMVEPDRERGRWLVHCSNHCPFILRERLGHALGMPQRAFRVVKSYVGGGFGGKQEPVFEILNTLMAIRTKRPVILEITREENLAMTRTRHADLIHIKSGLDENFRFVARDVEFICNNGGYSSHGHNVAYNQASHVAYLYPVENLHFRARSVYTNIQVAGAMRAYGAPQWHFAMESHIDNICQKFGLDRIEFRLKNHARIGGLFNAAGIMLRSQNLDDMIEYGRKEIGWDDFHPDNSGPIKRGIGMCIGNYAQNVYGHSVEVVGARCIVHEDGSATIFSGTTEIGQGAETTMQMIAAETLGIPYEWVNMPDGSDTDITPFDPGAYASRQTNVGGNAVKKAALACKNQILDYAAKDRELDRDKIDIKRGFLVNSETGEEICPLKDITWKMVYSFPEAELIEHFAYHYPMANGLTYLTAFAEVEVDTETGAVNVLKLRQYLDSGQIINPLAAKGQLYGGAMMSYGYGLTEQILINPKTGAVYNDTLLDYKIPTFADVPDLHCEFFSSYEPDTAYGNKSVGEPVNIGAACAIRNAVFNATGVPINQNPLTPERVWNHLHPVEED
ncbi:MAG: molybdopterin-dependent oxidoreductase [Lachnospiraceae bacterium]|nr:molybdopterin-dependent oxidoreductase [Lachnospiraceae bacterium]